MLLKRVGSQTTPPPGPSEATLPLLPLSKTPSSGNGTNSNFEGMRVATPVAPPPSTGSMPAIPGMGMPGLVIDRGRLTEFRNQIVNRIQTSIGPSTILMRDEKTIKELASKFRTIYEQLQVNLPPDQQKLLFDEVLAEMVGFGPLEALLADESITEIMVNSPEMIFVEQKGKLHETDIHFESDEHVMRIINRIIAPLGRRIDRKSPMVDARLPDGSRVNAIIPPCALKGPCITIRKFSKKPLTYTDLIRFGTVTEDMMKFLEACVVARLNIVVAGGTGSGKTTLLNVLSGFIPEDERIVTVEDAAELQLQQRHVISLETKKPEVDGSAEVTIRDLVKNCLRMRPDRIVVGECRGGEALDMLQAMNTGHDGSLTTAHANTPRDTCSRLETMCLMSGMDLPLKVIREQISSAVNLIVQQARLRDGQRKVTFITEVQGMESDQIVLQDIFHFVETGTDSNGKVMGDLKPTGLRPRFIDKLDIVGYKLPATMFGAVLPGMPGYNKDRNKSR